MVGMTAVAWTPAMLQLAKPQRATSRRARVSRDLTGTLTEGASLAKKPSSATATAATATAAVWSQAGKVGIAARAAAAAATAPQIVVLGFVIINFYTVL
jgi:hypothetical protein